MTFAVEKLWKRKKLEVGSWRFEVKSWKLEVKSWKLDGGSWKSKVGSWKSKVGSWKVEVKSMWISADWQDPGWNSGFPALGLGQTKSSICTTPWARPNGTLARPRLELI